MLCRFIRNRLARSLGEQNIMNYSNPKFEPIYVRLELLTYYRFTVTAFIEFVLINIVYFKKFGTYISHLSIILIHTVVNGIF